MGEERLPRGLMLQELIGGKDSSCTLGDERWSGWVAYRAICRSSVSSDGAKQHGRPADGTDGSRTERRPSCGDGMARRGVERQCNKSEEIQPFHRPSTPVRRGGGEAGDPAQEAK